jgi:hypothetical protein
MRKSASKINADKGSERTSRRLSAVTLAFCLLGFLFGPEDGDSMFLQTVGELLPEYKISHCRKYCSYSPP